MLLKVRPPSFPARRASVVLAGQRQSFLLNMVPVLPSWIWMPTLPRLLLSELPAVEHGAHIGVRAMWGTERPARLLLRR